MLEKTIESAVCLYARSEGWLVYKFVSPSNRGVPDRILIRNGVVFFIEFKATGKKMTKLQAHIKVKLNKEGLMVFTVDDIDHGKGVIDGMG